MLKKLKLFMAGAIMTTIIDKFNEFSDSQAETTVADHYSTYSFDTGGADIGSGEDTYLVVQVDITCTSDGSATVAVAYVESDNANLSSHTVLHTTSALGYATLVAGEQVVKIKIPANTKRYVGVMYTIGTAALTAGKFSAFLCKDITDTKTRMYPAGYTI